MDSGTQELSPQDFLLIAHHGVSSYAPENTMAAFDLALQMGASHLERDVHLTTRLAAFNDIYSYSGYNSQPRRPVLRTLNKCPPPVVT
jgi:hypothetical protein